MPACRHFDVLVVGAGLAGTAAALAAAQDGAHVALASAGPTFSGSSFSGGTWGLGLVGPRDEADAENLIGEIERVGCGMTDLTLVDTLVRGVPSAVERAERLGVGLRRAERPDERDFIPCFDKRCRSWHGLGRQGWKLAVGAELQRLGVTLLPHRELVDIVEDGRHVSGALLWNGETQALEGICAPTLILAAGGFGGLWERSFAGPDVSGRAQAVALAHGASLVNCEFQQLMPGLVWPVPGAVFNERSFRYARVEGMDGPDAHDLLASRATHGPFTARLADRRVDLALCAAGDAGAQVTWELPDPLPEFMATYFDWYHDELGANPTDGCRIVPFAHASNGGVRIDKHARVAGGPAGLLACGECTGGMHGADRIGGLSSANCLVFGDVAGHEAARLAAGAGHDAPTVTDALGMASVTDADEDALAQMRHVMQKECLVVRTGDGLAAAARKLDGLAERVEAGDFRCQQSLLSARALASAMLARAESRGAHFRADYPHEDPAAAQPRQVRLSSGRPVSKRV